MAAFSTAAAPAPGLLDCYDFEAPDERHVLPAEIDEASGLVSTAPGVFVTHNDGSAQLYELRVATGTLEVRPLNTHRDHSDFEGVTVLDDAFYLLNSRGRLWRQIPHAAAMQTFAPKFLHQCNFEGITLRAATHQLLLICKYILPADRDTRNEMRIYTVDAHAPELAFDVISIDTKALHRQFGLKRLRPSALEWVVGPERLLALAGKERLILEFSDTYQLIRAETLNFLHHPQAEGLSIDPCGTIALVDESQWWRRGALSLYRPQRSRGPHCPALEAELRRHCGDQTD